MTDFAAGRRAARFVLAGLAALSLLVAACSSPDSEPPAAAATAPPGAPPSGHHGRPGGHAGAG
ncbi:MAG TPA: hypothetical protein VGH76_13860, partial [Actinomycetospora sp.]